MSKIEFNFKEKQIDNLVSVLSMLKGEFDKESICILRKDRMEFIGVDAEVNYGKGNKEPTVNSMLKINILYSDIFEEIEISDYESPIYMPISTFLEKFKSNLSELKDSGGGDSVFIVSYDEYMDYSIIKSKYYLDMLNQELGSGETLGCIYVATKIWFKSKKISINIDLLSITMSTGTLIANRNKFNIYNNKEFYTNTAKFYIGVDDIKSINNLIKNTNSQLSIKDGYINIVYDKNNPNIIDIGNSYFNYYLEIDRDDESMEIYLDESFEYTINSKVMNKIQGHVYSMEFYDKNKTIDTALIVKSMKYDSIYITPTKISI